MHTQFVPRAVLFQSAPSVRRATYPRVQVEIVEGFQSAPSVRRATAKDEQTAEALKISIRALREEGDRADVLGHFAVGISIRALREEGDRAPCSPRM